MAYSVLHRLLSTGPLSRTLSSSRFVAADSLNVEPTRSPSSSGFSILELIVVVAMVGILASIAAPGWLALANRQRLNSARDEVLQTIRSTQGSAKQTRRPRSITFDTSGSIPVVQGIELGSGNFRANMVTMTVTDGADTAVSDIEFDQRGTISDEYAEDIEWPIKITFATYNGNGAKRCIFVDSLLVSTRLKTGSDCN